MAFIVGLVAGAGPAHAQPLTPGNVLVSDEVFSGSGRVREFTPAGALVRTFTYPVSPPADFQPRDIVVDVNHNIQIYNGTFTPVLTTLDPVSGNVVSNTPFTGWSTVNNTTYGGLAAAGKYVFATDMATAGGEPNGIVRFDVTNSTAVRFGSGVANGSGDYIDVAVGRDGLVYAQFPGTSPGGNQVDVYDPVTMAFLRRINLNINLRAIAVDANGDLFAVANNDGNVYHFDTLGNLLAAVPTPSGGYSDIDIDGSGRLVFVSNGTVVLSDRTLASFATLNVGTTSPAAQFTAWVQDPVAVVPEPGSLLLLGGFTLVGSAWRRVKNAWPNRGRDRGPCVGYGHRTTLAG
jgi:hypothetical protein